jgi:beta-glucosidase-like glycosyl hydrolase
LLRTKQYFNNVIVVDDGSTAEVAKLGGTMQSPEES